MGLHLMARVLLGLADAALATNTGIEGPFTRTRLTDQELLAAIRSGLTTADVAELDPRRREILDVLHRRQHLSWRLIDGDEVKGTLSCLTRGLPLVIPARKFDDAGGPGDAAEPPLSELGDMSLLRPQGHQWLLESATSGFSATLCTALASALLDPQVQGVDPEWASLLHHAGLLRHDEAIGPWWEFHDRYYSSRSSLDMRPAGGTFRLAGMVDPLPLRRVEAPTVVVELPEPKDSGAGPGIWEVISTRRSIRHFSDRPTTLEDVSHLLHRTLRLRSINPRDDARPESYDSATRAVPSAGGMQSVDLWLWCPGVPGIDAGPWRYDPEAHALVSQGAASTWPVPSLALTTSPIQGVLVVNHARLAWKYQRIAYHLGLQDAGVALHALQLSAWAAGLGFHPLGALPHREVITGLGLDADRERPVSAFALGWPADTTPRSTHA